MTSRMQSALWAALAALALTASVTVLPAPLRAAPEAEKPAAEDPEVKMGRETHEELLKSGIKFIRDPEIVQRVEKIGQKIAAAANDTELTPLYGTTRPARYEYRFFVVDDKDVNAFSLPGGFIYVNKGLLDYVQSDDELAGVLAHEVLHAKHHHVSRLQREQSRLNSQLAIGLLAAILARVPSEDTYNLMTGFQLLAVQKLNGHGQNAERDADHGAILVARKAGYNPVGALTFMERLARDEKSRRYTELGIFRTHPPSRDRADAMIAQITELGLPINRREVTNAVKASTRTAEAGGGKATELVLGDEVMFRSASAERAENAARVLNRLLDEDLQIYDVKKEGTRLLARGETILAAKPEDAALSRMSSAEDLTDQAYRVLRNALYKQILDGTY